jgi:hypothetical protein
MHIVDKKLENLGKCSQIWLNLLVNHPIDLPHEIEEKKNPAPLRPPFSPVGYNKQFFTSWELDLL